MSLVTDLVEHYQQAIERGELTPEDVPTRTQMAEDWECSTATAGEVRTLLINAGVIEPLIVLNQPLGPISDLVMAFEFFPRVLPRDAHGCLLWDGTVSRGYGRFSLNGRQVQAHQVAWEYRNGPVPTGLELDHVFARGCRSKLCVNPQHLEPVTHAENSRRKHVAARWRAGIQVRTELDAD